MVWYCLSPSRSGAVYMWLYTSIYNPWVSESSICRYTSLNYVGQGQFSLHSHKYFVWFSMSDGCFVCILRILLYRRSVKPDLGCALYNSLSFCLQLHDQSSSFYWPFILPCNSWLFQHWSKLTVACLMNCVVVICLVNLAQCCLWGHIEQRWSSLSPVDQLPRLVYCILSYFLSVQHLLYSEVVWNDHISRHGYRNMYLGVLEF